MKWIFQQHSVTFVLLLLDVFVTSQLWAEESGERVATSNKLVDIAPLLEIEQRILPDCLQSGHNRHQDLPAYYWAENPELRDQFTEAQRIYETNSVRPYRAMTLVAGAAGVGKTFIKGKVFKSTYAADDVCKFDLKELYQDWQTQGLVEERPDLCCQDVVLNRLLAVKDQTKHQRFLIDFLQAKAAAFYVIDSLDEIHPDDYPWVLNQIEKFVFADDRQFVQVAVFGRGLAFREYWQAKRLAGSSPGPQLFMLNPPKFKTTGDLLVSSWNYDGFRYKLRWSANGGDPAEMSFDDYRNWAQQGFPKTGDFRSVSYAENKSINSAVRDLLTEWSTTQRVVGPMLYNLAGNGILREIVERHALNGQLFSERQVMEEYLIAWMERESKSENRPCIASGQHFDLYLQLLQAVAVKYLAENKVDKNGFFEVKESDVIESNEGMTFSVASILDHSGMKYIDPREVGAAKYRFEPIWFHRLLVQMHNETVLKQVSN